MQCLDDIRWTAEGLVPVIAQDAGDGRVLMFAWMNRESLSLTIEQGKAVYWSRSRARLWRKGEESGYEQIIKEIRFDCDEDVLLISVEQRGGIACHTGRRSCFYRRLNAQGEWEEVDEIIRDPREIYQ